MCLCGTRQLRQHAAQSRRGVTDMEHYYWHEALVLATCVFAATHDTEAHHPHWNTDRMRVCTWVSLPASDGQKPVIILVYHSWLIQSSLVTWFTGSWNPLIAKLSQYHLSHWVWSDLATFWSPQSLIFTATASQAGTCSHWHQACSTHTMVYWY